MATNCCSLRNNRKKRYPSIEVRVWWGWDHRNRESGGMGQLQGLLVLQTPQGGGVGKKKDLTSFFGPESTFVKMTQKIEDRGSWEM